MPHSHKSCCNSSAGDESSGSDQYDYSINVYFCCSYSAELIPDVEKILADNAKYSPLLGKSRDITVGGSNIFISTNSDDDQFVSVGFIAIDGTAIEGTLEADARTSYINIEPTEMVKLEAEYSPQVAFVEDMHAYIRVELTRKCLDTSSLYCGWRAIVTGFDADNSSESSSSGEKN